MEDTHTTDTIQLLVRGACQGKTLLLAVPVHGTVADVWLALERRMGVQELHRHAYLRHGTRLLDYTSAELARTLQDVRLEHGSAVELSIRGGRRH